MVSSSKVHVLFTLFALCLYSPLSPVLGNVKAAAVTGGRVRDSSNIDSEISRDTVSMAQQAQEGDVSTPVELISCLCEYTDDKDNFQWKQVSAPAANFPNGCQIKEASKTAHYRYGSCLNTSDCFNCKAAPHQAATIINIATCLV